MSRDLDVIVRCFRNINTTSLSCTITTICIVKIKIFNEQYIKSYSFHYFTCIIINFKKNYCSYIFTASHVLKKKKEIDNQCLSIDNFQHIQAQIFMVFFFEAFDDKIKNLNAPKVSVPNSRKGRGGGGGGRLMTYIQYIIT